MHIRVFVKTQAQIKNQIRKPMTMINKKDIMELVEN